VEEWGIREGNLIDTKGFGDRSVLLFDLGGVLVDLGSPSEAMELELNADEFWNLWLGSHIVHEYETGLISSKEFFEQFGSAVGISDPEEFESRFQRWQLRVFPGAEALIRSLAKTHRLALLSNTNDVHWQSVLSRTQIFSVFSDLFLSYEIGHLKPNPEVFEFVLDKLGCAPSEVLFFDDTEKNVIAAKKLAIDAVQVNGIDDVAAVRRSG